jgi:hypothetical protein
MSTAIIHGKEYKNTLNVVLIITEDRNRTQKQLFKIEKVLKGGDL